MALSRRSGSGEENVCRTSSGGKPDDRGPSRRPGPPLTVLHGRRVPRWGAGHTRGPRAVELRVPACAEALAVVRAMTGTLASYEDLDRETAADLALAVDEACTVLIGMAAAGAPLVLVEEPRGHEVNVRVSTVCAGDETEGVDPDGGFTLSGFSRRVLEALTDKVRTFADHIESEDSGTGGPAFGISLTIRRRWAPARA